MVWSVTSSRLKIQRSARLLEEHQIVFVVCNLLSSVHPRQNLLRNYGSGWRHVCHNAQNNQQYLLHIIITTTIRNDHLNYKFNSLYVCKEVYISCMSNKLVVSYHTALWNSLFDLIQACDIKDKPLKLLLYYLHNDCTYTIYQVVLYLMRNKYIKVNLQIVLTIIVAPFCHRGWHSYKCHYTYPVAYFQGCATSINSWGPMDYNFVTQPFTARHVRFTKKLGFGSLGMTQVWKDYVIPP